MMRLANELDDYLDMSMAFRGIFPYREKIMAYGTEAMALAKNLLSPAFVRELEAVFDAHMNQTIPNVLMTGYRDSYELPMLKWLKKDFIERLSVRAKERLGWFKARKRELREKVEV